MSAPKIPKDQVCNTCNEKLANHLTLKWNEDNPKYRCCKCYILEGGYPAEYHPICKKTYKNRAPKKN
jgi:hypothetical protein